MKPACLLGSIRGVLKSLAFALVVTCAGPAAVAVAAPLPEAFLAATFLTNPIPADGSAGSILRVQVLRLSDAAPGDDGATVTLTVDPASVGICAVAGAATAESVVTEGHADFLIISMRLPGLCRAMATVMGAAPAEATLVTKDGGTPTRLTVSGNDSPQNVGGSVTLSVDSDDVYVNLVGGDETTIVTPSLDPASCSGAPGGPVTVAAVNDGIAIDGRAWFVARSIGAYASCRLTFTSPGLLAAVAAVSFAGGAPDHLSCVFIPGSVGPSAIATASVELRDVFDNPVSSFRPYRITFERATGDSTTIVSDDARRMILGAAFFFVQSGSSAGRDDYVVSVAATSTESLPVPSAACSIVVRPETP